MATYVNDLRLTELATGEGSGTWGVTTNTNLELIGEALGYGTQDCFATDADATTTVADGASDPARAMYFKVTSSATLTATRTLTIGPNTVSRVMLIENATTGSQSIAISQGSGGNVTIANGAVKMVYLDGAGAGAAVVDAMADLELGTITVANLTATTADINGGTIDGATLGGSSQVTITDADMNGGTIDGVVIGGASAAAGTFTNLTASGTVSFSGATVSDGGTVTTVNIDGGSIDGTVIGAATPAAGSFTTGQFGTSLNVDGTVTADGLTVGSSGTVLINATSRNLPSVGVPQVQLEGSGTGASTVLTTNTASDSTPSAFALLKARGTSVVQINDELGRISFNGWDGSNERESASISTFVDTFPGSSDMPGRLVFKTTPDASATPLERMRIASNGDISFYEPTGTNARIVYDASAAFIVNEDGADFDFRVESDTNTHMLFVDAGSNHVNIGTSTDLTGVLNVDGNVALSGAGTAGRYIALLSETDAYAGRLVLQAGGGSAAYGGSIVMYGHSHASKAGDVVLGISQGSGGQFRVHNNGIDTGVDVLTIGESGDFVTFPYANNAAVFNQSGVDADFRVESDSNAHALFVDAGNSRVGMGTGSPTTALHLSESNSGNYASVVLLSNSANAAADRSGIYGSAAPGNSTPYRGGITFWSGDTGRVSIHTGNNASPDEGTVVSFSSTGTAQFYSDAGNSVIFNEQGNDADFRVESDTNTHALFVDAGNNTVNINRTSGPASLNVQSDSGADGIAIYGRSSDNISQLTMYNSGGTGLSQLQTRPQYFDIRSLADVPVIISPNASGKFYVYSGETVVNENSADHDFRVESDTNANALFVDAGNSRVGINTTYINAGTLQVQANSNEQAITAKVATDVNSLFQGFNSSDALIFQVTGSGSFVSNTDSVFNENGADLDFRVESDNNTHALFVDAGNDRVTIGGRFAVDESGGSGITNYRTYQMVNGQATAAASNTWLDVVDVGVTAALTAKVIAVETTDKVGTWVGSVAVAYGGESSTVQDEVYIGGTITDIDVRYNNTASTIQINVTYTGAAPTIYWTIDGMNFGEMSNLA